MNSKNTLWGLVLIIFGVLFLANSLFDIHLFRSFEFWPLFILGLGIIFEYKYFTTGRNPSLLVPGGILTTIGLLFMFETITNWKFAGYTWPVYELAVAIGLFQLYLFTGRKKGLLVLVFILAFLGFFSLAALIYSNLLYMIDFNIVVPALVILSGILIIFKNAGRKG